MNAVVEMRAHRAEVAQRLVGAAPEAVGMIDWDALERKAGALQVRYALEFPRFVRGLRKMNRWDERRLYAQP